MTMNTKMLIPTTIKYCKLRSVDLFLIKHEKINYSIINFFFVTLLYDHKKMERESKSMTPT